MKKLNHYKAFKKASKQNKRKIQEGLDDVTNKIIKVYKDKGIIVTSEHIPLLNKFLSRNEYLGGEKIKEAVDYLMNVVKLTEYIEVFLNHFIDIKLETFRLIQDWYEYRKRLHILSKLDGAIQDEEIYTRVVKSFYYKMRKELLKGNLWELGFGVGEIEVTRIKRIVRYNKEGDQIFQPDWRESMKKKKEIIKRGGTPRSKDDPDGEDWLVPNKEPYMVGFNWKRSPSLLRNSYHFEFIPLRGKHNPATELFDYRRENPTADFNYRIIERKKSK